MTGPTLVKKRTPLVGMPSAEPLNEADLCAVRDVTSPDTAHAINVALALLADEDAPGAVLVVLSKLCLMDLRHQDGEALICVLLTHVTVYAEAVAAGLLEVDPAEKAALARLMDFAVMKRPTTTVADLVYRVKRLAVSDAAALYSVDN